MIGYGQYYKIGWLGFYWRSFRIFLLRNKLDEKLNFNVSFNFSSSGNIWWYVNSIVGIDFL